MTAADAHLELLHVAASPGVPGTRSLVRSMRTQLCAEMREFAADHDVTDVVADYRVEFGAVQQVIPKVAGTCGADLVCMVSRTSGSFLGSTVDAVLRSLKGIPLLVVRPS